MRKYFLTIFALLVYAAGTGAQEPDANVLHLNFTETCAPIENEHSLLDCRITFSEDGRQLHLTTNNATATYSLATVTGMYHRNGTPTLSLVADEDPQHAGVFYTTVYSGLETYELPEGVTAYTATINPGDSTITITSIEDNIIPQHQAVMLQSATRAFSLEAILPVLGSDGAANDFLGSDVYIARPAGTTYVLSAQETEGSQSMAFYPYPGDLIPANKAYLHLSPGTPAPSRIVWGNSPIVTELENVKGQGDSDKTGDKVLRNGQLYIIKSGRMYNAQGQTISPSNSQFIIK